MKLWFLFIPKLEFSFEEQLHQLYSLHFVQRLHQLVLEQVHEVDSLLLLHAHPSVRNRNDDPQRILRLPVLVVALDLLTRVFHEHIEQLHHVLRTQVEWLDVFVYFGEYLVLDLQHQFQLELLVAGLQLVVQERHQLVRNLRIK